MSERGYILGARRIHAPADESIPPSLHPGYGTVARSLCGRYTGGVYAASVALRFGDPPCKFCGALSPTLAHDVARASADSGVGPANAIHEYHCGCDRPGDSAVCVAQPVAEFAAIAAASSGDTETEGTA